MIIFFKILDPKIKVMKIIKLSLLVFFGLAMFTNCKDDDSQTQFESTALISGFDMALCAC